MPKYQLETSSKFEKQYKKLSQKDKEVLLLLCIRIGSHSELFGG
ncbi:hypothetical protein [Helicobacter mesocricetorum]|nr:hypothetical protein [Helicobacter mesocricetorum]